MWRKKLSADGLNFYDWKERGTESGGSPSASAKPEMGGWIDQGCCPPLPAPPHCSTSHLPITHPTPPSSALPRLLLLARLSPSLILVPCVCVCVRVFASSARPLSRASQGLTSATAPTDRPTPGLLRVSSKSSESIPLRIRHISYIYYSAPSRSSRRLVSCSERVVFEPSAHPVVAVAYLHANFTDCTCLAMLV